MISLFKDKGEEPDELVCEHAVKGQQFTNMARWLEISIDTYQKGKIAEADKRWAK